MFVSVFQELSEAEMTALLNMIQRPESPQEAGRLDDLLRAAVAATAEGDGNRAMGPLAELAAASPRRAETLASLPSLSSIRGQVERLVGRLNAAAKVVAESQLAQAVKLMESSVAKELVVGEIRAENLIVVAGRLIDAGGYANSVWSAELSQLVIDPHLWVPNAVPLPLQIEDTVNRGRTAGCGILGTIFANTRLVCDVLQSKARIRRMWVRAPLLVLLLVWFVMGLAGVAAKREGTNWLEVYRERRDFLPDQGRICRETVPTIGREFRNDSRPMD
jgi:hypothetical protein